MSCRINLNTERYFCPDDSLKTCKTEQKLQQKASKRKTETIKVMKKLLHEDLSVLISFLTVVPQERSLVKGKELGMGKANEIDSTKPDEKSLHCNVTKDIISDTGTSEPADSFPKLGKKADTLTVRDLKLELSKRGQPIDGTKKG
jgi:hypothetical protein